MRLIVINRLTALKIIWEMLFWNYFPQKHFKLL